MDFFIFYATDSGDIPTDSCSGADWPSVPLDVEGLITRVLTLPYSDDTKASILHGNAERILGIR